MDSKNTDLLGVKTTGTVFHLLELLKEMDGGGVTEIANRTEMAKSSVHRHLNSLEEMEYVVKEGNQYHVGLRFLSLGEYARNRKREYVLAKEKVKDLAEATDERAQFIVEEHGYALYVHRAFGRNAVKTNSGIGKRMPIHSTSAGKVILADYPTEKVDAIIDRHGLPSLTDNTVDSKEQLLEELDAVRKQGYAVNDQETVEGLRAVSVPVKGADGHVIGALGISGPSHRMKGEWFENDIPDLLLGTTNELELNIAYP